MTKKCSIFKVIFCLIISSKWGVLAKNRYSETFFVLSFAENRKFVSLFVLEIFELKDWTSDPKSPQNRSKTDPEPGDGSWGAACPRVSRLTARRCPEGVWTESGRLEVKK